MPTAPQRQQPQRPGVVVSFARGIRTVSNTRYEFGMDKMGAKFSNEPVVLLDLGDSTTSQQATCRGPISIARQWKPPGNIAGWYISPLMAAAASKNGTGAITSWNDGGSTKSETYAWPFAQIGPAGDSVTTITEITNPGTNPVTGVPNPTALFARVAAFTDVPTAFQGLGEYTIGPRGASMFGQCWANGEWITGSADNIIQVGIVYLSHANALTSDLDLYITEGRGLLAGDTETLAALPTTYTASSANDARITWINIAANRCNTAVNPGLTAAPLIESLRGVGTLSPGDQAINDDTPPANSWHTATRPNADWTGTWAIRYIFDSATVNQNGKSFVHLGTLVRNNTYLATTGSLFYLNCSTSGASTDSHAGASPNYTTQQLANTLTLLGTGLGQRVNVVRVRLGENATAAQYTGGTTSVYSAILAGHQAVVSKIKAAAALAGIPTPLIMFVSPGKNTASGAKSLQYYTDVNRAHRTIAESDSDVCHLSWFQWVEDRYTDNEKYTSTGNVWKGLSVDGAHQTLRGIDEEGALEWNTIKKYIAA